MEKKPELPKSSTTGDSTTISKSHNAIHGNLYHAKLLTLVLIRATVAKHQFELAAEMPLGGKFDDIVFRYIVQDDTTEGKHWRYRYVQAKHKLHENAKITTRDLLDDKDNDFNLRKYFRSYCHMIARGEDIHDCIICTNIGFNEASLNEKGIVLMPLTDSDNIFAFKAEECGKTSARYQFQINEDLRRRMIESWSDVQSLADILRTSASNKTTLDIRHGVLQSYHVALVKEKVIDLQTGKFHNDFVVNEEKALTEGALQLREIFESHNDWKGWTFQFNKKNFGAGKSQEEGSLPVMVKETEIRGFFDKLVFVNTPNEVELDEIRNKEISDQFKSHGELPSSYIFNEMLDWFKDMKPKSEWMTQEDGKKLLEKTKDKLEFEKITYLSTEYQKELVKVMEFNDDAVCEIKEKMKVFLSDSSNKVLRIMSPLPKCTAAKIIAAVKTMKNKGDKTDVGYLTIPSRCLKDIEVKERLKSACALNGTYRFLILVFENDNSIEDCKFYLDLFPQDQKEMIVILIGEKNDVNHSNLMLHDTISYHQLSESTRKTLLSKTISFQKTDRTVKDLIGDDDPCSVIDLPSIQELMFWDHKVAIPSSNMLRFDQSLYIKRTLTFTGSLYEEQFWDKLSKKLSCGKAELQLQFKIDH